MIIAQEPWLGEFEPESHVHLVSSEIFKQFEVNMVSSERFEQFEVTIFRTEI